MKRIDIGLVGCGFVSNDHFRAWKRVQNAQVVAISDLNEALAKRTAEFWKIPNYYTTFSDLLEHNDLDIIDICTPPSTHASLATEAMMKNYDVIIEKPMTMTTKHAEEIVKCQKATGVKAGVIHNWLFEPPVLKATSLVKKGHLGEVIHINIEVLSTKYDSMTMNEHHWCHSLPGGRFSEMLAHPIYLARHFLGEVEKVDVWASKIGKCVWMKSDELCAIFETGNKLGSVYASFNAPRDAIFISLYGTKAILILDVINATVNILPRRKTTRFSKGLDSLWQAAQLVGSTGKNISRIASRNWLSGHEMYIKLFAQSVSENREIPVPLEEGHEVIKILEEMCNKIKLEETRRSQ